MKKNLFVSAMLMMGASLFIGCNKNNEEQQKVVKDEMTSEEKESAKKEISNVAKFIIDNAAKMDVETAMKPYLNSPDFLVVNPDGTHANYDEMRAKNIEVFKQLASFKQENIKEDFRFITKDDVLFTWFGKNEVVLKNGDTIKNDSYIGTMLMKKIDGEWKIAFAQETASPTIEIKAK